MSFSSDLREELIETLAGFDDDLMMKVLDGQEERMKTDVDIKLIDGVFNFIQTEYYNQIIKGEYYGGADTEWDYYTY